MSNCGECLMNDVEIVELVNGICPRCGADYSAPICDPDPDPARGRDGIKVHRWPLARPVRVGDRCCCGKRTADLHLAAALNKHP